MAKIPFDIKFRPQIESGEYKVETRDGRPARIICWDRQQEYYPLTVLVSGNAGEDCISYTIEGRYYYDRETHDYNLFLITPEPELKESEDERTRKEIIEHFLPHKNELLVKKWIAYLEKQKEQKPTEWSEEDKNAIQFSIDWLSIYRDRHAINQKTKEEISFCIDKLSSLCPQPKKTLETLVQEESVNKVKGPYSQGVFEKPHWKPSEEQMQALKHAYSMMNGQAGTDLANLYYDLKKL